MCEVGADRARIIRDRINARVARGTAYLRQELPARFNYACRFVSLLRRSPKPSRAVLAFQECLEKVHK